MTSILNSTWLGHWRTFVKIWNLIGVAPSCSSFYSRHCNLIYIEHKIKTAFVSSMDWWKENLWVVLRKSENFPGKSGLWRTPSLSSNTHQSKQTASLHEHAGDKFLPQFSPKTHLSWSSNNFIFFISAPFRFKSVSATHSVPVKWHYLVWSYWRLGKNNETKRAPPPSCSCLCHCHLAFSIWPSQNLSI